jgi:Tol biopolymer transport system component
VTVLATQGRNVAPRWSPDGQKILFWSDRTGIPQVWVMNADGSSETQLTQGGGLEGDWSPDGARIVFRGRDNNLWVMNAAGTNIVLLFAGPGQDAAPQWSPDGTRIAFDGVRGVNVDIFLIDADGTNLVRVTNHPAADWGSSWSPDGTRIAFFSHPGASGEVRQGQSTSSDIFTVSPEGSEAGLTLLLGRPTDDIGPVYGPAQ